MEFGHRYRGSGRISPHADYIQFNICGLSAIEIVQRYFLYEINKPMILLGDYTSKERNAREDDMLSADRIYEVKDAINSLMAFGAKILAITLHPVSKKGLDRFTNVSFKQYIDKLSEIYQIPVLVKNVKCEELFLSNPEEIIEFSQANKLTIDGMFLYETCGYDRIYFLDTLSKMNASNVLEVHRHSNDGQNALIEKRELGQSEVYNVIDHLRQVSWVTLLFSHGGHGEFDSAVNRIVMARKDN